MDLHHEDGHGNSGFNRLVINVTDGKCCFSLVEQVQPVLGAANAEPVLVQIAAELAGILNNQLVVIFNKI